MPRSIRRGLVYAKIRSAREPKGGERKREKREGEEVTERGEG